MLADFVDVDVDVEVDVVLVLLSVAVDAAGAIVEFCLWDDVVATGRTVDAAAFATVVG